MTRAWIGFDRFDYNHEYFETETEAKKWAEDTLAEYRGDAMDGWPEDLEVGYAKVVAVSVEKELADRKNFTAEEWAEEGYDSSFDKYVNYEMTETTATLALHDTIAERDKRIAYLENEVKQFNEVLAEANELSKEKTWPQA